jgi:hypothetical protein
MAACLEPPGVEGRRVKKRSPGGLLNDFLVAAARFELATFGL